MDPETKRTLITCCITVFGTISTISAVIITQFFTYLNSKSNKNDSIYKQQYDKVFSPIHRILFFTDLKDNDKIKRIYNIIYSNYNLSTELLREEFNKCTSINIITSDFENIINDGCKCLERALGYTKTKLSKQQKEISKTVIYSDIKFKNSGFTLILFYILLQSIFFADMILLKKYYISFGFTEKEVETIEIFLALMIFAFIGLRIFKALSKK